MKITNLTKQGEARTLKREDLIALAREIRREFAQLHTCMDRMLHHAPHKKAA